MIHARSLKRAVRHALDESRDEEVLDLVDAEPRVGVRHRRLAVYKVDRETETEKLSHVDRLRVGFDFAVDVRARAPLPRFCAAGVDPRFFFAPPALSPLSRAQLKVALTARCHPAINPCAASLGIAGVNRVNCLVPMNSPASRHTPPAIPARPAAPSAVVSIMSGRSTGMPSMSDWNCNNQLLADAPPSTRNDSKLTRARFAITASISAEPYAIASSAALAKWALPVPRVMPKTVPRARGSQFGAPSPTRAGTKYTPSFESSERASRSLSGAL